MGYFKIVPGKEEALCRKRIQERTEKEMREKILEARGLCKNYGAFRALEHLDLWVNRGEIYGLVGDNGAGKTTFLKLAAGQLFPDGGELRLFGKSSGDGKGELDRQRKRIGALIENPGFYPQMTVEKNLEYYRIQKGIPGREALEEALEEVGLTEYRKRLGRQLSLGMKQRLGLAIALLGKPELLMLDEPINGLDPTGIVEMRELLLRLSREQRITIIISSHILGELEQLADIYGFLDRGVLLEQIHREALMKKCGDYIEIRVSEGERYCVLLERRLPEQEYQVMPDGSIHILRPEREIGFYSELAVKNSLSILALEQRRDTLEEYFMKLKKERREGVGVC